MKFNFMMADIYPDFIFDIDPQGSKVEENVYFVFSSFVGVFLLFSCWSILQ